MVGIDVVYFHIFVVSVLYSVILVSAFTDGVEEGKCIICARHKTFQASQNRSGDVITPLFIYRKLKCKFQVIFSSA
jgi:hypothetical protein